MKSVITRFRAYQLGCAGSSFSYFADGYFTLIEARLNDTSAPSVRHEMVNCGVETINCVHITSWDADHCSASELPVLLEALLPTKIECPGYEPKSDNGVESRKIIRAYEAKRLRTNRPIELKFITPDYISSLSATTGLAFKDVMYNPRWIDEYRANNNSTAKLFRTGQLQPAEPRRHGGPRHIGSVAEGQVSHA